MSISSLQHDIQRYSKDVADLQKQRSDESKKEADKSQRMSQLKSSINKNTSASTRASKEHDINKLLQEIANIQSKRATIEKRLAEKTSQLYKAQEQLMKEEDKERKKTEEAAKKKQKELEQWQKRLANDIAAQKQVTSSNFVSEFTSVRPIMPMISYPVIKFDVFISHASEDKEDFVRPLAEHLQKIGFRVWYDEFTLKIGDNLRRSIDYGLANSRYGIVVMSSAFFAKEWPQYELDSLVIREIEGGKVILPIWHKVSKDEVMSYSLSLANKVALNSSMYSIEEIAAKLSEVLHES